MSTVDFFYGTMFVDYIGNKLIGYGRIKFASIVLKYPKFKAYGERFRTANQIYLENRI